MKCRFHNCTIGSLTVNLNPTFNTKTSVEAEFDQVVSQYVD